MNQTSKPRYPTTNWKQYNAALKARGSLSIWLDKRISWFAAGRGKPHHSLGQQMVDETLVFKAALQLEQLGAITGLGTGAELVHAKPTGSHRLLYATTPLLEL